MRERRARSLRSYGEPPRASCPGPGPARLAGPVLRGPGRELGAVKCKGADPGLGLAAPQRAPPCCDVTGLAAGRCGRSRARLGGERGARP
ncbi:unnamed protein product [Caretta caretta]